MAIKRQAGFTLIELIIAMTISMGLAVIALVGFSSLRAQTQFSDAVERLRESVVQRRTEANGTVQTPGAEDYTKIIIGRIITFRPGGVVEVRTLSTANTPNPASSQAVTATADNLVSYTIPWGVVYNGVQVGLSTVTAVKQVAFVRSAIDGSLHTAVSPNNGWSGVATNNYTYGDFIHVSVDVPVSLSVTDGTRQAWIEITPLTNGVARRFK